MMDCSKHVNMWNVKIDGFPIKSIESIDGTLATVDDIFIASIFGGHKYKLSDIYFGICSSFGILIDTGYWFSSR